MNQRYLPLKLEWWRHYYIIHHTLLIAYQSVGLFQLPNHHLQCVWYRNIILSSENLPKVDEHLHMTTPYPIIHREKALRWTPITVHCAVKAWCRVDETACYWHVSWSWWTYRTTSIDEEKFIRIPRGLRIIRRSGGCAQNPQKGPHHSIPG